ncbi:hypothetical protein [Streptomyces sp. NPDC089919]|uniref:hypothetical protein n=1 Tax=Streptomyces sp. NPDC089919 TaxID=3155188 RepID=UPI00343A1EA3
MITGKDYLGYFLNEHGEELVFAQRRGEKTARFWQPQVVDLGLFEERVAAIGAV